MQISAKSVKFCFYTQHTPKSNRESEPNLVFGDDKDRLVLGLFLKYVESFANAKSGYQICFYLLNLQEAYH